MVKFSTIDLNYKNKVSPGKQWFSLYSPGNNGFRANSGDGGYAVPDELIKHKTSKTSMTWTSLNYCLLE